MKAFVSILILAVIGGIIWLFNTAFIAFSNGVISFIMSAPIVLIAVGVGVIILLLSLFSESDSGSVWGVIFIIGGVIIGGPVQAYNNAVAFHNASTPTVLNEGEAEGLSFAERVPYDVATAVSDRSLGNTNGNANGIIKAVPKDNEYTTLVVKRGVFQGYESVQAMKLPEYGSFSFSTDIKFCKFDEKAQYRFGGLGFNNNIDPKAYWTAAQGFNPFIHIDEHDSFAVCDGETPKLYMPATKMKFEGLLTYRVPAGVVIYDGHTNEFSYEEELTVNGFAVYPSSLAQSQRESTVYGEGFWNYAMSKAGFETTNETDEEDTNASNSTEFVLENLTGKQTDYVTPLTPRGSSSSVVALATVEASTVKSGELNKLVINMYDQPRQAPSTVASNIVSTVLSGYKANGLTVFEVVPSKGGNWTATIGKNQSILYRAVIDADGNTSLYDADGVSVSEDEVDGEEPGNTAENEKPSSSANVEGKKVEDMSVEELKQLMNAITEELAERAS